MSEQKKRLNKSRRNNFLVQGSILAIAGILVRIIGAVYRIPLLQILGDKGMGDYAAAYSIYAALLLISSYSLPLAVSKLVSARVAKKEYRNSYRVFQGSMIFAILSGAIVSLITFFGADALANLIGFPNSALALRVLSPTLLIVAVMGVLRGYFQGRATMIPSAISQLIEQMINAVISVGAAYLLLNYGLEYAAAGGTIGTGVGALAGLLFLMFIFSIYKPYIKKQNKKDTTKQLEPYSKIAVVILGTIAPVIISTAIYNMIDIVDTGIWGNILAHKGYTDDQVRILWGTYSGGYKIITNIPIAIAASLGASLVPGITIALAKKEEMKQVHKKIGSAIRLSMIITMPSAVGAGVLAGPLLQFLTNRVPSDLAIGLLQAGAFSIVLYSLSTMTNAILQSINKMKSPIIHSLIALCIHVIVLVILLFYNFELYGVIISNIVFAFVMCILNAHVIRKNIRYKQEMIKTFILPSISAGVMGAAALGVFNFTYSLIKINSICTLIAIFAAMIIYFTVMILLKGLDEESLNSIPKGKNIIKLCKKLKLMR